MFVIVIVVVVVLSVFLQISPNFSTLILLTDDIGRNDVSSTCERRGKEFLET